MLQFAHGQSFSNVEGSIEAAVPHAFASIDEVRNAADFIPFKDQPEIFESSFDKYYWIRFPFEPITSGFLIFDFGYKFKVEMYVLLDGRVVSYGRTGLAIPGGQKDFPRANAIQVQLKPDQKYMVYVKLMNGYNTSEKIFDVSHKDDWFEILLGKFVWGTALVAVLLIFSIFSVLIYVQNKNKSFLYFGLYLFVTFLFFLNVFDIVRKFIFLDTPEIAHYFVPVGLLSCYFYLEFMQEFMDARKLFPKWSRFYQKLGYLSLVVAGVGWISILLFDNVLFMSYLVRYFLIIMVIAGLHLVYIILRSKNQLGLYFSIGSFFFYVGAMIDLVIWTSSYGDTGNFTKIGVLLQITLMSLGLGKKHQLGEKEKNEAKEMLIRQLQLNEKLNFQKHEELEEMVNERTRELRMAKELAERNAKSKTNFMSVMSHEIRTPMNAIAGLTHMLDRSSSTKEFDENLITLRHSVDSLTLLINNILDYNKVSSGKIELESIDFDVTKVVRQSARLFKSRAQNKGLKLGVFIDEQIPHIVNGDPFRLSQILNNFLSNAVKFTTEGFVAVSAKLLALSEEIVSIRFEVSDTGIGIPKQKQKDIFESFVQVGKETSRVYGGTGLGLTIAKSLIRMMKGRLKIRSAMGEGTTFAVELDLKLAIEQEVHEVVHTEEEMQARLSKLKVLIVDDNELNRMVLQKFVAKWGIEYESANNGLEAVNKMKFSKFDVILLDLQMPEMDGYEVAKYMKATRRLAHIPIVALSADNISNVKERVMKAGIDEFMTKPFMPEDLRKILVNFTHMQEQKI